MTTMRRELLASALWLLGGGLFGLSLLGGCTSEDQGPVAPQLGNGDGTPGSVTLTLIYEPEAPLQATDVDFNPLRPNELWITHRRHPPYQPCFEADPNPDCLLVEGSVAILADGTAPLSGWVRATDSNAWHFMRLPPGIAFGAGATFGTCGDARTGNFDDDLYDYIGPTLFSTDLTLFGAPPASEEMNGSHLDMLHASPYCVGIAHERDNAYWVQNGKEGSLERYDFHRDHGPGNDDHSDGEIWHYNAGALTRVPEVPAHLAYHHGDERVYAADAGGGRVVSIDPAEAASVGAYEPNYDALATHQVMSGALREIVGAERLRTPSGLVIHHDILFVADNATSTLFAFTLEGELVRKLDTGMPPGTLTGITIGPDDKLYFADGLTGRAYRVDP
jgi:hypothetical protein